MAQPDTNKNKRGSKAYREQRAKDFAAQKVSQAKDFNFNQYDRKNTDGKTHVSGSEVAHLRKGVEGSLDDKIAALQAQKDAGAVFGKQAQRQFDNMLGRQERKANRQAAKEKAAAAQSTPPAQEAQENNSNANPDAQSVELDQPGQTGNQYNQENDTSIENTQTQNVSQDNDVNTNIDGNNNYVKVDQDNSIRQYGGDNRSFVYNSNGGGGLDTPGSMATLAGFYAPDDSAAANASRLDRYQTMNRDAQKKYSDTSHIAQGAIARANQNSYIDPAKLDQRIAAREQNSYDRAALIGLDLYGDLGNMNFDWKSNTPAEKVKQPDFGEMKDEYTDFD